MALIASGVSIWLPREVFELRHAVDAPVGFGDALRGKARAVAGFQRRPFQTRQLAHAAHHAEITNQNMSEFVRSLIEE